MTAPATVVPASKTVSKGKPKGKPARTEAEKVAAAAARKLETPEARFLRLTKPRIAKAVSALRRLETIGRSPSYQFTTEQANRVMGYLDAAVEAVRVAFVNRVNRKAEPSITL